MCPIDETILKVNKVGNESFSWFFFFGLVLFWFQIIWVVAKAVSIL